MQFLSHQYYAGCNSASRINNDRKVIRSNGSKIEIVGLFKIEEMTRNKGRERIIHRRE